MKKLFYPLILILFTLACQQEPEVSPVESLRQAPGFRDYLAVIEADMIRTYEANKLGADPGAPTPLPESLRPLLQKYPPEVFREAFKKSLEYTFDNLPVKIDVSHYRNARTDTTNCADDFIKDWNFNAQEYAYARLACGFGSWGAWMAMAACQWFAYLQLDRAQERAFNEFIDCMYH